MQLLSACRGHMLCTETSSGMCCCRRTTCQHRCIPPSACAADGLAGLHHGMCCLCSHNMTTHEHASCMRNCAFFHHAAGSNKTECQVNHCPAARPPAMTRTTKLLQRQVAPAQQSIQQNRCRSRPSSLTARPHSHHPHGTWPMRPGDIVSS